VYREDSRKLHRSQHGIRAGVAGWPSPACGGAPRKEGPQEGISSTQANPAHFARVGQTNLGRGCRPRHCRSAEVQEWFGRPAALLRMKRNVTTHFW
jgi:hypothetical protein